MNETKTKMIDFDTLHEKLRKTSLFNHKGKVVRVSGLTVESTGPKAAMGRQCRIKLKSNQTEVMAEVVGFRDNHLILLPLENVDGICPGDTVEELNRERYIELDESILGRVLDGLGRPMDDKGPLVCSEKRVLESKSPCPLSREMIAEPLSLGIRSIDGLLTCGKGQRVGVFAGSGVGKSVLLGELANSSDATVNVVALVGERGREVREFLEKDLGPEGLARSVVVVATSDSAPIQRVKAAFTAATIAEYFRDKGADVLFMMDSLTRFAQAQREIGIAAGEPPATKGYTPSVFTLLARMVERLGCNDKGTITGLLTVLVEGDDLSDPVADSARSLLDGHIVLSRKLADRGHYPAIDILSSVSRLMSTVAKEEHKRAAMNFREIYAIYKDAEDLINIGAFSPGSNKKIDGSIALIEQITRFLIQGRREVSSFDQTVSRLMEISDKWTNLLGNNVSNSQTNNAQPASTGNGPGRALQQNPGKMS
jgi:flagellum-specific ATP synthase